MILCQTRNKFDFYHLQTSPLIQATCHKHYADMVQLLMVLADPTQPSSHRMTPIMYAASLVSVPTEMGLCKVSGGPQRENLEKS